MYFFPCIPGSHIFYSLLLWLEPLYNIFLLRSLLQWCYRWTWVIEIWKAPNFSTNVGKKRITLHQSLKCVIRDRNKSFNILFIKNLSEQNWDEIAFYLNFESECDQHERMTNHEISLSFMNWFVHKIKETISNHWWSAINCLLYCEDWFATNTSFNAILGLDGALA